MGWAPGEAGRCGSQQLRGRGMGTVATAFLFVLEGDAGFMKETVSSACNVVTATPHWKQHWHIYSVHVCVQSCFSCVWLCATLWTAARQAPLSMGFSRQGYWSGLPCPPQGIIYTSPHVKQTVSGHLLCSTSVLSNDLEGWGWEWVAGELKKERVYIHTQLIHFVVQQKSMQHCKAIILWSKVNLKI